MKCKVCDIPLRQCYPDRPDWYLRLLTYCPEHNNVRRARPEKSRPLADKFWEKVRKDGNIPPRYPSLGPCWLWAGAPGNNGYGHLGRGPYDPPGSNKAHVISWELHYGPVPKGGWVLHHCDIPPCVNPIHLFLGDAKINAEDRERKGRGQKQKGASSHRAKLTWEQVVEIRTTYDKKAGITQKVLAERFGVSDQQISRILSGKNYQVPE